MQHSKVLNPYKTRLLSNENNISNHVHVGTVSYDSNISNENEAVEVESSKKPNRQNAVLNPYKKTTRQSHQQQPQSRVHQPTAKFINPYKRKNHSSNAITSNYSDSMGMNAHALVNRVMPLTQKPLPKFQNPYLKKKRPLPSSSNIFTDGLKSNSQPMPAPTLPVAGKQPKSNTVDVLQTQQPSACGLRSNRLEIDTAREKAPKVRKVMQDSGHKSEEMTDLPESSESQESGFDYGSQWNEDSEPMVLPPDTLETTSHARKLFQSNDDHTTRNSSIPEVTPKTKPLHHNQNCTQTGESNSCGGDAKTPSSVPLPSQSDHSVLHTKAQFAAAPKTSYQTPSIASRRNTEYIMHRNMCTTHQDSIGLNPTPLAAQKVPSVTPHQSTQKTLRITNTHPVQNMLTSNLSSVACTPTPHTHSNASNPSLENHERSSNSIKKANNNPYRKTIVPASNGKVASTSKVTITPHVKVAPNLTSLSKNPYAKNNPYTNRSNPSSMTPAAATATATTPHDPKTPAKSKRISFNSPSPKNNGFRWKARSSKLPYPKMTFLADALREAQHALHESSSVPIDPTQRAVRIQGVVMTDPTNVCYNDNHRNSSAGTKRLAFCLDDGSCVIDVLYEKSCGKNKKEQIDELEKLNFLSSLSLTPLREVAKGDRIECRGYIQYVQSNDQQSTSTPCFFVGSVSFISDPNHEILRIAQIDYSRRISLKDGNKMPVEPRFSCPKRVTEGMHVFGNARGRKASPIIYEGDKVLVDPDRLMHLISLSKPDGLTFQNLETIFHFDTVQEICALRNSLKMLQANYAICISRTGSYLPM